MDSQKKFGKSLGKLFVLVTGLVVAIYAFAIAPRKVVIPAISQNGVNAGVTLLNGSSVSVSYNVRCYNSAGSLLFTKSNQQLGAKAQTSHGAAPSCRNGTTIGTNTSYFSNGMMECNGTSYANRAASCPIGYTVCTNTEAVARKGSVGYSNYWVDFGVSSSVGASSNSYYYSSNAGTNWSGNYSGGYPTFTPTQTDSYCFFGSAPTDGTLPGGSVQHCGSYYAYAALCCPTSSAEVSSSSCEIEILDTNSEEGYLQSPAFKGNSPF